jgi:hypothetical protein
VTGVVPEVIVSDRGAENKNGGSGPPNNGTVRVSLLIPSWLVVDISNETPTASVGRSNALCTSTTNTPVDSSNMAAFHRPPLKPGPLDRPVEEPTITSLDANWATSCGSVASMSTNNDVWLAGAGTSPFISSAALMRSKQLSPCSTSVAEN